MIGLLITQIGVLIMCEFISWKRGPDNHIYFLTDAEVFSSRGKETLAGTKNNDAIGHGAIDAFYGRTTEGLTKSENRDFWHEYNFPAEISKHLESPKTLLATWGKMLKQYLQPDDALYILKHAPEPWKSALADICISCVAKDEQIAYLTLRDVNGLTEKQKTLLRKSL